MVTTIIISKVGVSKTGGAGVLEYTSLASWEANRRGNITAADRDTIEVAEVYGGGSVGPILMDAANWTVDATHYIWIRAATGEGHGGTFNVNKAYLTNSTSTIWHNVGYTKIGPGLSIESTTEMALACAFVSGGPIIINGCIIKGASISYGASYFYGTNNGVNIVKNCTYISPYISCIYGFGGANTSIAVYNCTLICDGVSLKRDTQGTLTSQNNYIRGGYGVGVTKGSNDVTSDKKAFSSTLRNIPYTDPTTTQIWAEVGSNAYPIAISYTTPVVFDNGSGSKIWSIGGYNHSNIYSSSNGSSWTLEGNVPTAGPYGHASVVYAGKMWVIGGAGVSTVYSSSNGSSWSTVGNLPGVRYGASAVIFDDGGGSKIWVIGGSATRTVYSSADGITWTEAGGTGYNALPVVKDWHTSVVHAGKMWVIGGSGGTSREVYSSTDGITWTLVGNLPKAISLHASVVYDGKMWVIGGGSDLLSVYSSTDGITWIHSYSQGLPSGGYRIGCVLYNNKMWTIGGYNLTTGESNTKTVYSFPNTPTSATFQSVTDGSENLRPVVSMANKLLDNGANLTSSGVTTDIIGTARPQNGAFDIGAFENDIPLCWNYTARYKGSNKLFKASGCGSFPKNFRVPGNIDISTGRMVDDGILINPDEYRIV